MHTILVLLALLAMCLSRSAAFSSVSQITYNNNGILQQQRTSTSSPLCKDWMVSKSTSILHMAPPADGKGGMEKSKDKKKGVSTIVIDKTDTQMEEEDTPEEMWRVVLHNDEVHTFNYVIRSLQKVMGTLDKKKAFDICTVTHGQGQATVDTCWKEQAMKYCLGLQRQGLTASIAPDGKFEGGGKGGGGGGGGPESG